MQKTTGLKQIVRSLNMELTSFFILWKIEKEAYGF